MRCARSVVTTWMVVLALAGRVHAQGPLTTAFTYQGELANNGVPASGLHAL